MARSAVILTAAPAVTSATTRAAQPYRAAPASRPRPPCRSGVLRWRRRVVRHHPCRSGVLRPRRRLPLDRVLDAFHPSIAPRPRPDEADLLQHPHRGGVLDKGVSEYAAESKDLERVCDERLSPLGGVAEPPGVPPKTEA